MSAFIFINQPIESLFSSIQAHFERNIFILTLIFEKWKTAFTQAKLPKTVYVYERGKKLPHNGILYFVFRLSQFSEIKL